MPDWNEHYCRCREVLHDEPDPPPSEKLQSLTDDIEPWLSALIQSEHLSLLVGNGLTRATAFGLDASAPSMDEIKFGWALEAQVSANAEVSAQASERGNTNMEDQLRAAQSLFEGLRLSAADKTGVPVEQTVEQIKANDKLLSDFVASVIGCVLEAKVNAHAARTAKDSERGKANMEDQLRAAQSLIEGLRIIEANETGEPGVQTTEWIKAYDKVLTDLVARVIDTERSIAEKFREHGGNDPSGLLNFLLSFASRPPTRERLELFTTNYDRLIEHACDHLGIRLLDRFVGMITPQFRTSRVNVDMHFDPPGIRGEPHYLEGVARLTKLHGSLDWRLDDQNVVRIALPFGPPNGFPTLADDPYRRVMIYPNAAKDVETLAFPYAELFRDFAAALCRPNATLFVYGYSFGDDHINRVIRDMLTISSTHVVIVSYSKCDGRLEKFCRKAGHEDQISLLVGEHFGNLSTLTKRYLPRTLIEAIRQREEDVRESRPHEKKPGPSTVPPGGVDHDHAS